MSRPTAALGTGKSGGLIMAAIAQVFTIGYVANLLGEDQDWLYDRRHGPGRRLPLGLRHRRGWRARLHRQRHREPAPDHRRPTRRRPRTAAGQIRRVARPAVLTAWRRFSEICAKVGDDLTG